MPMPSGVRIAVVAAALCAIGPEAMGMGLPPPAAEQMAPPAKPDAVAAARDASDRMTVPVLVDGRGPYPFVIDTGADRTVISRELADALGLKPGDPVVLNGTGGVDLTPTARIDRLNVGAREIREVAAPTLSAANLGAAGMLGIDSLRGQRMVMDFHARRMSVEPSKRDMFGNDVIVVRARSRFGQLVLVDASIAGKPIYVILDSGAQNTIGNLALRDLVAARYTGEARPPAQVISVSGRTTPAQFSSLPLVKIGGFAVGNMPIAFADLHTFAEFDMNHEPAMLLGMDVLRQFERVAVDFGRREVVFRLRLDP